MGQIMIICIYLGYMGNGYGVLGFNENSQYRLLFINTACSEKQPGDLFDVLPYGTVCRITIREEVNHYSASLVPGADQGAMQYNYCFVDGSITRDMHKEISLTGETFSVYNRDSGKRIHLLLDTIQGKKVTAGVDLVSRPEWIFAEPENYLELSDADYDRLAAEWKKHYERGEKLFVKMILSSHREEYTNVWAPSGGTTVKHSWIIGKIETE